MQNNHTKDLYSQKIISYIRLAKKSGTLVAGFDACVNDCRKGQLELVIATEDLSARSIRNLENKCGTTAKIIVFGQSSVLNKETGLSNKKILGIGNKHLASIIEKFYEMYIKS